MMAVRTGLPLGPKLRKGGRLDEQEAGVIPDVLVVRREEEPPARRQGEIRNDTRKIFGEVRHVHRFECGGVSRYLVINGPDEPPATLSFGRMSQAVDRPAASTSDTGQANHFGIVGRRE